MDQKIRGLQNRNENSENATLISASLESLNKQAESRSYSVDDINWNLTINRQKFWAPECLISISHLPVYKEMSHELKLLWNHLNAIGVAENFMFFERNSLVPSMTAALEKTTEPEMRKAMQHFIDEEIKHALCFKKLILKAAPDLYDENNFKFRFIKLSPLSRIGFQVLKQFPNILPAWIWLAIFFEERTLMFSREYITDHKKKTGSVDELFYQTHFYHMIDEVRHVKMDEYFIKHFYKTYGGWHACFGAWAVTQVLKRVTYPHSMAQACIEHIKLLAPHLLSAQMEARIYQELRLLGTTPSFIEQNLSAAAAPRTKILMQEFPEFKNFWRDLLTA